MDVGNIQPNQQVIIKIQLISALKIKDGQHYSFTFPSDFLPKYKSKQEQRAPLSEVFPPYDFNFEIVFHQSLELENVILPKMKNESF
mmetsp:Transcript_20228/g.19172  ORF Transcript_20228/g.19172 Transcript_20228/m.19172 type:complete len:87 (+) Transcript_20228:233-493(+)